MNQEAIRERIKKDAHLLNEWYRVPLSLSKQLASRHIGVATELFTGAYVERIYTLLGEARPSLSFGFAQVEAPQDYWLDLKEEFDQEGYRTVLRVRVKVSSLDENFLPQEVKVLGYKVFTEGGEEDTYSINERKFLRKQDALDLYNMWINE